MKKKRTAVLAAAVILRRGRGAWLFWLATRAGARRRRARPTRGPVVVTVDEEGKTRVADRFVVTAPVPGRLVPAASSTRATCSPAAPSWRVSTRFHWTRGRAPSVGASRVAHALPSGGRRTELQAAAAAEQAQRNRARIEQLAEDGRHRAAQEREQAELAETVRAAGVGGRALRGQGRRVRVGGRARRRCCAPSRAARGLRWFAAPSAGRVLKILEESERAVVRRDAAARGRRSVSARGRRSTSSRRDAVRVRPGARMLARGLGRPRGAAGDACASSSRRHSRRLSALGVEEQRVHVVGDLSSPPAALGDGFRVESRIVVAEVKDVVRVPASALFRKGDAWAVFAVAEGRARLRIVERASRTGRTSRCAVASPPANPSSSIRATASRRGGVCVPEVTLSRGRRAA